MALLLLVAGPAVCGETGPVRLENRLVISESPPWYLADLAWGPAGDLLLATHKGIEGMDPSSGARHVLIAAGPLSHGGARSPFGVATRGNRVLAFSLAEHWVGCWNLDDRKTIFAFRNLPDFMIKDVALWGANRWAVLGFPRDGSGRMADSDGVAVWAGPLEPGWDLLWPVHLLAGGARVRTRFEMALWPLGGFLAVEDDGTLDIVSPVEVGIHRYAADGRPKGILGGDLQQLVPHGIERAFSEFGSDPIERHRQVVNRQLWIDGLLATVDGPAVIVRMPGNDRIRWEIWWPGPSGVRYRRTVPFEVSTRSNPTAHLRCDLEGERIACAVRVRDRKGPPRWNVLVMTLPSRDGEQNAKGEKHESLKNDSVGR